MKELFPSCWSIRLLTAAVFLLVAVLLWSARNPRRAALHVRAALACGLFLWGIGFLHEEAFRGNYLLLSRAVPLRADLWTYVTGARVHCEGGMDPYRNRSIRAFLESKGGEPTSLEERPLSEYARRMNYRLEDENGKGSIGYAGSPLLLPLHFGLYRCFGFKRLDLLWTLFSLLGLSVTTVLFAGRLFGRGWILILASVGALWGFAPTALSLQLGQMEGLYVPLVTMALYLLAFHSLRADGKVNRPALCACGLLLAAASAVKIYPAVLGIYLGMSGLAEARFKRKALVQTPAGQAGVWFLGGLIGIAGSAFLAFGPELLGSFAERIRLLDRLDAANLHEYRPSFADYITHAARWLAPGGNFHLRAGGVAGLFQIGLAWAGGLTVCRLARSFPRDSDPRRYLLGFSWTLMALPTLMRHWWSYYGVIQFIPLLITITFCAGVQNPRTRLGIEGLLIAGLFFAHPESVRFLLWMAGVPSRELPFLVATPGPPHLIRPGPAALLFGWPGQLLLLAATWITLLRSRSAS